MSCNERGMALVSVVVLLAVLLTLAHILAEKVWQSTRQTSDAANREQLFWAAQAGIQTARQQLAASYSDSAGWQSFLTASEPRAYPAVPVWTTESSGLPVEIYLRDNQDGDGDLSRDNDLKVFVLARARGRRGNTATIECLCGFEPSAMAGSLPQSLAPVTGPGIGLADLPVNQHGITD